MNSIRFIFSFLFANKKHQIKSTDDYSVFVCAVVVVAAAAVVPVVVG